MDRRGIEGRIERIVNLKTALQKHESNAKRNAASERILLGRHWTRVGEDVAASAASRPLNEGFLAVMH